MTMNEQKVDNYPEFVNINGTNIILGQMQNSICKIYKANGTGFFCILPFIKEKLKVLITDYHVINEKFLKENNFIKLGINNDSLFKDITLEKDRKIYMNEVNDLTIIEIKDKDNLNEINYLEFDNKLLEENSESFYLTENSIYIIQYPKLKEAAVSYGILKQINDSNQIIHLCSTEQGSSGSPILNLKTNKVIGLHLGSTANFNYNIGTFLKKPIEQLIKNNLMKYIGEFINKDDLDLKKFENIKWNKDDKIIERYIEDGIYNIFPKHCKNRAIDISGASNFNMANLQLYEFNNTNSQKFEVKYNHQHKYYTIKCLCSNKYLDVDYKNNFNIVQYQENNKINQQWYIVRKDNIYEIISKMNGYLMTVDGSGVNSWTNISCKPNSGGLNQKYQFEIPPTPQGIKYFKKTLYNGNSIVDGLKSIEEESSFQYRALIAKINGIEEYNKLNNANSNEKMLKLLKEGKLKKP